MTMSGVAWRRVPLSREILRRGKRLLVDMNSLLRAFFGPPIPDGALTSLNIQTTNICNANCIFCAYQYQDGFCRARGIMEDDLFEKAVLEHREAGGRFVSIAPMLGEPLIDPKFVTRLTYVAARGLDVSFFTNGILLKRIDLRGLMSSGVRSFVLSTGPFQKSIYERIYRSKRYDDLLEGVTKLLALRNSLRAEVVVHFAIKSSIPRRQALALPDFREKIWPLLNEEERLTVNVSTRGFDSWAGQIRDSDLIAGMSLALPPRVKRRPCRWTFVPIIMWDGKVRACACKFLGDGRGEGVDEMVVGDLRESSLPDIWSGEEIRRLRKRFADGDPPRVCRQCTMYRPC